MRDDNYYLRGVGDVVFSKGIGIVQLTFIREVGGVFRANATGWGTLSPLTISGRVTYNGDPVPGICVSNAYSLFSITIHAITDVRGVFSLKTYGGSTVLRYGPLASGGDILDIPMSNEYVIESLSGDVDDLELVLSQEPPSPPVSSVTLYFNQGWNLIGFNLQPIDPRVEVVFSGWTKHIRAIYGYLDGEWTYWFPGLPSSISFDCGRGFWVLTDSAVNLTLTGLPGSSPTLKSGWNLVAASSPEPVALAAFLGDSNWSMVYGYDSSTQGWLYNIRGIGGDLEYLEPGHGYWIFIEG
jgi:hypothetical protein